MRSPYLLPHAYDCCCEDDNIYYCYLSFGNSSIYLWSLTIGTLICGRNYWLSLHWLVYNCLISFQNIFVVLTLIGFLATCGSFVFVNLSSVSLDIVKVVIQSCAFCIQMKILYNAQLLGSYHLMIRIKCVLLEGIFSLVLCVIINLLRA